MSLKVQLLAEKVRLEENLAAGIVILANIRLEEEQYEESSESEDEEEVYEQEVYVQTAKQPGAQKVYKKIDIDRFSPELKEESAQ